MNRQVAALIEAGLLRERADLAESGAVGRPRIPIEVDHDTYLTIGIHVGATTTGIVASDLRGRTLGGIEIPTPTVGSVAAVRALARSAVAFADRYRRTPLWVGVALGGRVDAASGIVDHPRLGWEAVPVGEVVADVVGLPVSVSAHVEAMAAAELLLAPAGHTGAGSTLYVYARETAGVAIALDGKVHTPNGGPGSIAHLPTGSTVVCDCGRRGCLEATVGDRGVVTQAVERGIVSPTTTSIAAVHAAAHDGGPAHELLVERAEFLGHTVATLHDLLNPDRVILGGQAFTGYPARPAARRVGVRPGFDVGAQGDSGQWFRQPGAGARRRRDVAERPLRRSDRVDEAITGVTGCGGRAFPKHSRARSRAPPGTASSGRRGGRRRRGPR